MRRTQHSRSVEGASAAPILISGIPMTGILVMGIVVCVILTRGLQREITMLNLQTLQSSLGEAC